MARITISKKRVGKQLRAVWNASSLQAAEAELAALVAGEEAVAGRPRLREDHLVGELVVVLDQVREAGMRVNEPDRQPFLDASVALYEEFGASVDGGASLVDRASAAGSN